MPTSVFKSLVNLFSVNLKRNQIQIIDSDLFSYNKLLYFIHINNNSLRIIQTKSFRNNLYLTYLYINDNIRNLSNIDLFPEERTKILSLNISNCAFTQLYIPKNVEQINAQSNQINSITAHPKRILRHLDVRHNDLTDFACLPPLDNLRFLRIERNGIGFVEFDANLSWLSMDLNLKQNISAAKINTICSLLLNLYIDSPGNQKTTLLYDFKRHEAYAIENDGTIVSYSDMLDNDEKEC